MTTVHTRQYLDLLKAKSAADAQDGIVAEVTDALQHLRCWSHPIRLSSVASHFQIRPEPQIDPRIRSASLTFDRSAGEFVISISPRERGEQDDDTFGHRNARFLRFMYAHEFAHRFLFVLKDREWVRALAVVADRHPVASRLSVLNALSRIEERICNGAAARILIPSGLLTDCLKRSFNGGTTSHAVWDVLGEVAEEFAVSRWCALRRLSTARPIELENVISDSFCFLLIGDSRRTGGGNGVEAARVLDYLWARRASDVPIKPIFPGLAIDRLGADACVMVRAILNSTEQRGGEVACKVDLRHASTGDPIAARFSGYWRRWSGAPKPRIAIYGNLEAAD